MSQPGADRAGWPAARAERVEGGRDGGLGVAVVACVVCGHGSRREVAEVIAGFAAWLGAGDAVQAGRCCPSGACRV